MPVADLPPVAEIRREASPAPVVTQAEADATLIKLQASLKGTHFIKAWPAQLPGFIAVQLESGEVAYADKSGRYLVIGLVLDTTTGNALDRQLEGRP